MCVYIRALFYYSAVSVYNETSATLKTFINVGSEVLVDGVFT